MSKVNDGGLKKLDLTIYKIIRVCPLTREELVNITKKPRTSVFDAFYRLRAHGMARSFRIRRGSQSRPKTYFIGV